MLTANEIRQRFIKYFKQHKHKEIPSSSLIPREDPSLLFTNAGMVQFKKIFMGQEKSHYSRATTSQKCLRVGGKHNDLDNVGRTARHHTFFEMLGNFSFGDYFKKEAITFAWDFITQELKLPKERLYITIYTDDDEAHELWVNETDVAPNHIYRLGEKDNFWSMGDTGPCGPCSEIHIDQGVALSCGPKCGIGSCDCDRFLEIWNLVFMQYNQETTGERILLPKPSIDTGMGLERITAVCQGKTSNYDTDLFQPIIQYVEKIAHVHYQEHEDIDTALHVIADHSRAIAFMVADGILPSNDGRGYILRRLIRRAFRFGKFIGMQKPFLYNTSNKVVEFMGENYPELHEHATFMSRVVYEEEERFSVTLDKGLVILESEIEKLSQQKKTCIPGAIAFKLYDTYGFPLDIINDVALKKGFYVDESSFEEHMNEQKHRARMQWKGSGEKDIASFFQSLLKEGIQSTFIGYDHLSSSGNIIALLDYDGFPTDQLPTKTTGFLITNKTPFYGTSGGQVGDVGIITSPTGIVEVVDTLKPSPELTIHVVTVTEGYILVNQDIQMTVEESQRLDTARNHTCTHLLQAALRSILGDHVKQSGSLVTSTRLRFDFTHIAPLSQKELHTIEQQVNSAIMSDLPLSDEILEQKIALQKGAMALFGEKYGDHVRVITIGSKDHIESIELCGGTHLTTTGQAGCFIITSETGIASGIRRIEALTGRCALHYIQQQHASIVQSSTLLKTKPNELVEKITALTSENKMLRKKIETIETKTISIQGKQLLESIVKVNTIDFLAINLPTISIKTLREVMDDIRSKLPSNAVVCITTNEDTKVHLLLYVSKDLHHQFNAAELIKKITPPINGSGGGRADQAQAGGTNPEGIPNVFELLRKHIS